MGYTGLAVASLPSGPELSSDAAQLLEDKAGTLSFAACAGYVYVRGRCYQDSSNLETYLLQIGHAHAPQDVTPKTVSKVIREIGRVSDSFK
jgi:hypothetical protein